MTYRATIQHHSIARAEIVDLGTDNLATAKRRATAEFGGGFNDHMICILGEETPATRAASCPAAVSTQASGSTHDTRRALALHPNTNGDMRMETGTLKELNVKPGDVVEMEGCYGEKMTVISCPPLSDYFEDHWEIDCEETGVGLYPPSLIFRIVSRAAETPKLWRDMTPEEKGALLLAAHEGKVIEWGCGGDSDWAETKSPLWEVYNAYRIRPEPKRETRRLYYYENDEAMSLTLLGTIDLIDGKPDPASIRMDEL